MRLALVKKAEAIQSSLIVYLLVMTITIQAAAHTYPDSPTSKRATANGIDKF